MLRSLIQVGLVTTWLSLTPNQCQLTPKPPCLNYHLCFLRKALVIFFHFSFSTNDALWSCFLSK